MCAEKGGFDRSQCVYIFSLLGRTIGFTYWAVWRQLKTVVYCKGSRISSDGIFRGVTLVIRVVSLQHQLQDPHHLPYLYEVPSKICFMVIGLLFYLLPFTFYQCPHKPTTNPWLLWCPHRSQELKLDIVHVYILFVNRFYKSNNHCSPIHKVNQRRLIGDKLCKM